MPVEQQSYLLERVAQLEAMLEVLKAENAKLKNYRDQSAKLHVMKER